MPEAIIAGWGVIGLLVATVPAIRAQTAPDGVIKVTTTVHGDLSYTNMQINPDTKTAEGTTYNQAKKLIQRVVYTLDEQNEPAEGVVYNAAGNVVMKSKYVRDPANRISEEINYTPAGAVVRRLLYKYDGKGRVSGIQAFDGAGNPIQTPGAKGASGKKTKRRSR